MCCVNGEGGYEKHKDPRGSVWSMRIIHSTQLLVGKHAPPIVYSTALRK